MAHHEEDIPLADDREEYADLLLRVREAAAARGLTFREVMAAMARCALEVMAIRTWARGEAFTLEDVTMAIAQKKQQQQEATERAKTMTAADAATPRPSHRGGRPRKRPGQLRAELVKVLKDADAPLSARAIWETMGGLACGSTLNSVTVVLILNHTLVERIVANSGENGMQRRVLWRLRDQKAGE